MIHKIKELRNIVPIAMTEALQLLKENNGDVEKCADLFKQKCIDQICTETSCDRNTATEYFKAEKMDINRAISAIREKMYDDNYTAIPSLSLDGLLAVNKWLDIINSENFDTSLNYPEIDLVISTLKLIPQFDDIAQKTEKALIAKRRIFEGYSDKDSLDEFVRRSKLLDDDIEFQNAYQLLPLKVTVIKEDILRHIRNMRKLSQNNNS